MQPNDRQSKGGCWGVGVEGVGGAPPGTTPTPLLIGHKQWGQAMAPSVMEGVAGGAFCLAHAAKSPDAKLRLNSEYQGLTGIDIEACPRRGHRPLQSIELPPINPHHLQPQRGPPYTETHTDTTT